jgi:cell division protein FtsL
MAAWSEASALELPSPAQPRRRPKPKPRPAPARRRAPRARVFGGVVWIGFVAVLLTGIVAVNVAVLRLNMQLDELGRERANLRADNAALASRFSSARATARIESLARTQLGLVPAEPDDTAYVELSRSK